MIELENAVAEMKNYLSPQKETEKIYLSDAFGRVTAEKIISPIAVPSFARSGMDGYGVYWQDTKNASKKQPAKLKVIGTIHAGDDATKYSPQRGEAVRVMTGAALPTNLTSVVKQEWTNYGNAIVEIYHEIPEGKNYMAIGEDIKAQQQLIQPSEYLSSDSLGVIASVGITTVQVKKALRVGIISTGNELVSLGQKLEIGQIYNSSAYTLASYIKQSGSQVIFQVTCGDDVYLLEKILKKYQGKVDLIITTGGVSVGEKDFLPDAIDQLNGRQLFHYVDMKPGTPMMGALWQGIPILCLSGNPFATMVNFHLFYWSLLAHFLSNSKYDLKKKQVTIQCGELPVNRIRRFYRAFYFEGKVLIEEKKHQSSIFHNTINTNCLVEQPKNSMLLNGEKATIYQWPQIY